MHNFTKVITGILLMVVGFFLVTNPVYTSIKGLIVSTGFSIFTAIATAWIMIGTAFYGGYKFIKQA